MDKTILVHKKKNLSAQYKQWYFLLDWQPPRSEMLKIISVSFAGRAVQQPIYVIPLLMCGVSRPLRTTILKIFNLIVDND